MTAVVFPFDLFGSSGTGAGSQLLGDALHELLADAAEETRPTRADAFKDAVRIEEVEFDTPAAIRDWQPTGLRLAAKGLSAGEPMLWFAGNHLAVLPVFEKIGQDGLVVQFDAHFDLYNLAGCTEELSHGNFLRRAEGPLPPIVHVGSRDLFLPPAEVKKHLQKVWTAEQFVREPDRVEKQLKEIARKGPDLWVDLDCDVFDPAYFPAVQHPQPMGLSPAQVLRLLAVLDWKKVRGVSISEFDPGRDRNDQSLGTLIWLMEWCLLRWYERPRR
jgi:agmatinase